MCLEYLKETEEWEIEKIFGAIVTDNFTNLMKIVKPRIQEAQHTSNRRNMKSIS